MEQNDTNEVVNSDIQNEINSDIQKRVEANQNWKRAVNTMLEKKCFFGADITQYFDCSNSDE